jgi:transposase
MEESRIATTSAALQSYFGLRSPMRVALEACTQSPWVSRLIASMGHEVIVANPRRLRLVAESNNKSDQNDAELLARLGRADPLLLAPINHRREQTQADRAMLKSRDTLVRSRTLLVNSLRGQCKALGTRFPKCNTESVPRYIEHVPKELMPALAPLVAAVETISEQIATLDEQLAELSRTKYPETEALREIPGVGPVIALAFVLTVEDPGRFARRRDVGAYLGLTARRRQSGASDPQMHITKAGDPLMRKLLIQGAQHVMRARAPDSALKRWGQKLAERGGKGAKKRAVVAVARKLAVLMHRLWVTGEVYRPFPAQPAEAEAA